MPYWVGSCWMQSGCGNRSASAPMGASLADTKMRFQPRKNGNPRRKSLAGFTWFFKSVE